MYIMLNKKSSSSFFLIHKNNRFNYHYHANLYHSLLKYSPSISHLTYNLTPKVAIIGFLTPQ